MKQSPYAAMAPFYDRMNAGLNYARWADFIEAQFSRFAKEKPSLVLDLAAGSGSMTVELARRGYDMTAVDASADMLSLAAGRISEAGLSGVLLLEQDMTSFELYGTVSAVVCCLDSINHLTARGALARCFSLVHNYLDPDGLFLFDVNTPYKFRNVYGMNDFILEDGDVVCCWRNTFDEERALCDFDLTIFTEEADGRYRRTDTVQTERCYTEKQLRHALARAGFEVLGFYGDYDFTPAAEDDDRWYVAARCIKPAACADEASPGRA